VVVMEETNARYVNHSKEAVTPSPSTPHLSAAPAATVVRLAEPTGWAGDRPTAAVQPGADRWRAVAAIRDPSVHAQVLGKCSNMPARRPAAQGSHAHRRWGQRATPNPGPAVYPAGDATSAP
jgi:hypothetical protein